MPSISDGITTVDFDILRGQFQSLGMVLEEHTRPGIDGHAYRQVGRRGKAFEFEGTVACADETAANTTYESLMGMQGSLVTVVDAFGSSADNVALLSVELADRKTIGGALGWGVSGATELLVVKMQMQITELPSEIAP